MLTRGVCLLTIIAMASPAGAQSVGPTVDTARPYWDVVAEDPTFRPYPEVVARDGPLPAPRPPRSSAAAARPSAAPSSTPAPTPALTLAGAPTTAPMPPPAVAPAIAPAAPPAPPRAPTLAVSRQDPGAPRLNPSGRAMTIVAPLKDRDAFLGDVEMQIGADDSIHVSAAQVLDLLARSLDPTAADQLRLLAAEGPFTPIGRFAERGLPLTFDARLLELSVAIPTTARGRQSIGLADLDRELYGDFAQPEAFSAYVNFRGALDYIHKSSGDTGLGDPLVLIDGAARFGGWVVEGEATWDAGDRGFRREGTRAVYDDVQNLNRWTLGDLLPQGRGFQGVQDLAGISVARSYALMEPQRNVAPRGGRTFTLERDSTVEAFVNGRAVRTIRLQPGTYDVSDFPFVQGSNDVELIIIDDTGRREVVAFSLFIDRTQLAPGLSEYGFYAGVRSDLSGDEINYTDEFAASGYYRFGVSENLTLGGNFEYAEDASMVAGEAVWGTPWGTLGGDFAVSDLASVGSGWAANMSFERLIQTETGGTSLLATIEARSQRFGSSGQVAPDNPYVFNASLGVNQSFGDSSFAGAQVRYAKARDGFEDEQSVRLTYGRRLNDVTNVIFDADWSQGGFADDTSFRIALVRRFGSTGSARAEYDSLGERARLGYQTSGGRGVGAWSAAGNLDLTADNYGLNASAAYAANRADLGLAHNTAYSQTIDEISDQRTSLRGATSIAFAGGRFAIGRPISDGFVIVEPYAGARDVAIEVEPSPEGYYARSGLFGPALYGQVSAYSPRTVIFDAPEAPAGFDVGQGALRLLPPYRAGYLVTVGSDYGVTAIGRLLTADGEPLTLLAGEAVEQGGEGRRVEVFTNRSGAFGASGLKAGRWLIEMPGGRVYELLVPETSDGIARLGDLRPVQ